MTTAGSARTTLPTLAGLSLSSAHAHDDLVTLGWWNEESLDILSTLAAVGDPDLALNTLVRLFAALEDAPADREELAQAIRQDSGLRVRLFALVGGSTALGDHLVAHPGLWSQLSQPLPTTAEMFQTLLGAVEAQPANFAPELDYAGGEDGTGPGMYRAQLTGAAADQALKQAYRTFMMRIAAYDLAGTYPAPLDQEPQPVVPFSAVTTFLSDLADAALTAALAVAVRQVYGDSPVDAKLAVLAMGKCGAKELNYVSDVDVIFVAEPASPKATRMASEFIRYGSRCFFDVDAALRPEGKRGALVRTLESHLAYYTRWAHTWEFQALLKHRPMTGCLDLAQAYSQALSPMVWEASQRESFVADVQAMRRRVLENVPKELQQRELKLGEGGLRDVEFAVQLLQLVHGRSDESLRTLATVDALAALVAGGYIGREDGAALIGSYEFLRLLEHRLQLHKVLRTHTLPDAADTSHMRWLARTAGFTAASSHSSADAMLEQLRKVRLTISTLHRQLFYRPLLDSVVNLSVDQIKLSPAAAKVQLHALGYKFPDRAFEHLTALAAGGSRKAKIQAMLLPTLMEWLASTSDPDAGLLNYRKLSDVMVDRVWFLRLLRDEGIVGKRLMRILGNSPFTADLIIAAPDIVKQLGDSASGPKLLETSPHTVSTSLVKAASRHDNPERAIQVARSLRRAELARVAAADVLNLLGVEQVCLSLSLVWNAVLEAALQAEIRASVAALEAEKAPATISVIGMGRLGGEELGYGSDADVMFVCEPAPGVSDDDAVRWSIGICDAMRRRLAKPSGDPPLQVDLGLRPEGRSGAVVRTLESYRSYYQRWGETWEVQALLRAKWIAGDPLLGEKFLDMIDQFRYPPTGVDAKALREVRRMKARIDNERLPRGADRNTHTKLGRGGLVDIEWTAQLLILMHAHIYPDLRTPRTLEALRIAGEHELVTQDEVRKLCDAWLMATQARNATVLARGKRTDQLPQPGPQLSLVAGAAGRDPEFSQEFLEEYLKLTRRARQVVDKIFWGETLSEHGEYS
ncbi:bifunctional [glutamine synthetase] adenylyltransferase/[glutamine synthetase]-adenylyl-L-tyrosine phosphorylase [Corynebacterium sp. HS2168-gen11]|uniref:bifunctional [glutamine synthetase] adenylyltransferase/[glutamine synthetase]-adenylyl-L-tyrosine phosphorylase n=1 Tax=Corynebacterium sp. HS2168-gen11 TaxID=2974027 RepID=UPI00216AC14C|nr:bifunctional [glutamine synthetase] adenylyltransferase/[glutamine synthetase]-adenylyl-L-tyrosine phosphorylase [Corynebacterium sp. HS2168-gen11]MCS4535445.1 bifunctional [glutamine synthetase] adenylyltransferase/[glutamine synthetase]-adenylyl-L-tyrosine phosphorylase [Corynebacterium sp. HS2168-gen11]